MRVQVWLTLVVSLALSAGLAAFMLATPDQGRRPSANALGFQQLSNGRIQAALTHAAEHHRAAHRTQLTRRDAAIQARAWLLALAGSRHAPAALRAGRLPRPAAGSDAAAAARITGFVRWADDLPASIWSAGVGTARLDGEDAFVASGWVQVELAQADTRIRRLRVPVELTLRPAAAAAQPGGLPRGWQLVDLVASGPRTHLRAYADPVIIDGTHVDVVAPAASRASARAWAAAANRAYAALRQRYRPYARTDLATLWLLADGARAAGVLGEGAKRRSEPADGPHGAAWVTQDGDIVLDQSRLARRDEQQRRAAIRHALTHVATRELGGATPPLLAEGIALFEERGTGAGDVLRGADVDGLVAAFGRAESGLAGLLRARPDEALDHASASLEADLALATVAWVHDSRGSRALLQLLARLHAGTEPDRALRTVLRLDSRGVEVAVARWLRTRDAAQERSRAAANDDLTSPDPVEER